MLHGPTPHKHGRMSLADYLCVYLAFQWRRLLSRFHRGRIALHSRGLADLIRPRSMPELQKHPLARPEIATNSPHMASGRRILIVDIEPPRPDRDSGSVRCQNLMRLLVSLGYAVTLHCEGRMPARDEIDELRALGIDTSPYAGSDPRWLSENPDDYCATIVCRYHLGLAWLPLLRRMLPHCLHILDTVDLHHLRELREAELRSNKGLRAAAVATRRRELKAIQLADVSWVVSIAERNYLQKLAPGTCIEVIPNLHAMPEDVTPFAGRRGFIFVGGGRHPPNLDAADWLLRDIFPMIRSRLGDVQLHMVGPGLAEALRIDPHAYPGVIFHGHVPSLVSLLSSCRVSLAPLRFGAGVKGKVSEALAHGLPVVTTPSGAEGMHLRPGLDALICTDATMIAEAAVRVHEDPELWHRLSDNGRQIVLRHFSLQSTREKLSTLLP